MRRILITLLVVALGFGAWWVLRQGEEPEEPQGLQRAALEPQESVSQDAPVDLAVPDSQARERKLKSASMEEPGSDQPTATPEPSDPDEPTIPNPTLTIRALVVDFVGRPVRDTALELSYSALPEGSDAVNSELTHYSIRTNSKGRAQVELTLPRFKLKHIAVKVWDPSRHARGWVEPVRVIPDGRGDLGTIRIFEPREKYPGPLVQGRVLSEEGEPIPGLLGFLFPVPSITFEGLIAYDRLPRLWSDRNVGQVTIDADGYFKAYGPSIEFPVQMAFMDIPSRATITAPFKPPSTDMVVTVLSSSYLHGKLYVPKHGPPAEEYTVSVFPSALLMQRLPETDGTFSLLCSSQARKVRVSHWKNSTALLEFPVPDYATSQYQRGLFDLTPQVKVLDLIVTDPLSAPLSNQKIVLHIPGTTHTGAYLMTDDKGRLLTVVPAGTPIVTLALGNRQNTNQGIRVEISLDSAPSQVALPSPDKD